MKPNFEAVSERDILKKAELAKGSKKYIKRADIDMLAQLTGCGRDDMIDWLCDKGMSLDKGACGHSRFKNPTPRKEKKTAAPEEPPKPNFKDAILKIAEETLESMMEERERLKEEAEKARVAFESYNEECDAMAGLTAMLRRAESVTITEATT